MTRDSDRGEGRELGRSGRRVLITGATGFLGRPVVAALAAEGAKIRAAMRRLPDPPFDADIDIVQYPDLRQTFDWRPLLDGVDTVIHLAGMERKLRASAALYDQVNHQATARLAAAAAQAGVRHLIFASCLSAQTGSAADHALTERDPATPTDPQGRSKLAAETALRASGVPFTILRLAPVYGPGMTGGLAFLLRAAVSPVPLPVRDFTNRRSYLGMDNFISALKFIVALPAASNEVYLVADPGIPPNMADLIRAIRQAEGRRALLLPSQVQYAEIPLRLMRLGGFWDRYCGNLRVDSRKLIAAGWQPVYDTRTGIARLTQNSGAALRRVTPPAA
ncbi:MAG TPA: NAD-dependent epimerase/dehydratase family protein [Xanthobacteraceae bacterium]|nr:NAD-dependent epimerase/dehydratase family protein [Xanthobacteraceae bacterium]